MDTERHEPIVFAVGDTLAFARFLPEFPPSSNYFLQYDLVSDAGAVITQLTSTPSPDGNGHEVLAYNWGVDPVIDPTKSYVFVGFALNTGTQERHQIYSRSIRFTPNFNTAGPFDSQVLFEYQAVKEMRCLLLARMKTYVTESDIQRVKMVREEIVKIRTELCFWEERLFNRLAQESVNNGGPNPYVIRPVFAIC